MNIKVGCCWHELEICALPHICTTAGAEEKQDRRPVFLSDNNHSECLKPSIHIPIYKNLCCLFKPHRSGKMNIDFFTVNIHLDLTIFCTFCSPTLLVYWNLLLKSFSFLNRGSLDVPLVRHLSINTCWFDCLELSFCAPHS